ncbi:prepilin-type N-terminal cleavage/methylation domain-containing protein [Clostridium sp. JN-9]|uniref:prepilin-type N-terminal cleavage/methylation domain-containing protein n=1 Tax=Clostridium sp. JN-9 TaxID=2507159 RepID=UPI00196B0444|nr:prepilin-type N-terminal cleavage/methylation domain-containing protein [Clostridium sp. JN-9]
MSELILREKKQLLSKKKKKGFTLVELIAVIAILAILAAIIVPKVTGYTDKADRSKVQADAKTVLTAVQSYNADKGTDEQITKVDDASITKLSSAVAVPTYLKDKSVADLEKIAGGAEADFKVAKKGGIYTVTVTQ